MTTDRDRIERWNARHRASGAPPSGGQSPLVERAAEACIGRTALDVACGTGRHALYLASRGFSVVALDASQAALEILGATATARGLSERIETREIDLESSDVTDLLEPERFDLICVVHFLHRPLFEVLVRALKRGGVLATAIHLRDPSEQGKMNPAFTVSHGELESLFERLGLDVKHAWIDPRGEDAHSSAVSNVIAVRT